MQTFLDFLGSADLSRFATNFIIGITAICSCALLLTVVLRHRSAPLRQGILYIALGLVLLAPLATAFWAMAVGVATSLSRSTSRAFEMSQF